MAVASTPFATDLRDTTNRLPVRGVINRAWGRTLSVADTYVGEHFLPYFLGGLGFGFVALLVGDWTMAWPTCVIVWAVGLVHLIAISGWDLVAWVLRRAFGRF